MRHGEGSRPREAPRADQRLAGGQGPRNGAGRRSDQPTGLDRDRITEATVRLLDEEGLAKFSMRRLAAELNVTAMSVYWYVDTKDDLLELALDAAAGEMNLPDAESVTPGRWRETLRELASEYRGCWSGTPGCHRSSATSSTSARTGSSSR